MRSLSNRPTSKVSRLNLRRLLAGLIGSAGGPSDPARGRLLLESLESRQLLAGDVELLFTDGNDVPTSDTSSAETATGLSSQRTAEGELAPDLVQFAKDLDAAGVIFYGAHWCPACTQQKELFADGKDNLPFIEVTNSDRTLNQTGIDENITDFPTWVFPDDSRLVGIQTLETLSQRSGVAIPQSDQPTFEPVGDKTVQIGSPLHLPIDAYDPDGGPLTVTVSVSDPTLLEASVLSGNRSIRIDMEGYGDMVFELFEQRAPRASGRVADLADAGFYDGIIFHRVTSNFVIQAGDPTGTGTSGSTLGNFDDDFNAELQHNRSGVLSFAKSGDDTNNSQFFVTEVPTRFLDFNHSIFGQLVEGEDVREAISSTSTPESRQVGSSQRPDIDAVINTIEVFNDTENSVVMLKPTGNGTGSTNVTVTVTDQDGNSSSETFLVSVVADTANSQPFLNEIADPATQTQNTPATLQLSSVDVEGDAVTYFAQSLSGAASGVVAVDATTGLVTVTPATDFVGTINVEVGVRPGAGVFGNSGSDRDTQTVPFQFQGGVLVTPTSVDLLTGSDSGSSDIDNVTNLGSLTFTVDGVTSGATVELVVLSSGSVVGSGVATGSTVTITTNNIAALGDGAYQIVARQRDGNTTSGSSSPLSLVYDTTPPDSVAASASTQANVGRDYATDLVSDEEGSGLRYAFSSAPAGATIDTTTGVIGWTPTANQLGGNAFSLELTDAAGNVRSESFNVDVADAPLVEIRLVLTDLQGAIIDSIAAGQEFLMQFIGVDTRQFSFDRDGVFAAFADILFDSSLVRPVPGSVIDYDDRFPSVNKGTFSDGLIDELGAATDRLVASEIEESLIATVRFEALATGTVNIRSEPADAADSEVLLYGNDNQIGANAVAYGSVSLAIGQSFTIADDTFTVAEDSGSTTLDVLTNDLVVSGTQTLTVVSVTQPAAGGTVTLEGGVVRFNPDADFNGTSEFTYRVSDSNGVQENASVTVTVTPVNDPPTGISDTFNVDSDTSNNSLNVLANDSIAPDSGETLSVSAVGATSAGATVTVDNDNSISYTPPAGFTGTDTFSYTLSDGTTTTEVQVNVTVALADNPPTGVDDAFSIIEDDGEAEFDVLSNDTRDIDNQTFVIDSVGVPSEGGSARVSNDGTQFFYAPAANFNGTEQVTYTIRDSGGGLSVATVTFTVSSVNDAPPVVDTTVTLNRATGATSVLGLDGLPANVDSGETLTFNSTFGTPTAGGTVSLDVASQSIRYTPPSNDFTGTDTFTYTVADGNGLTSTGTITINVSDFTERDIFVDFAQGLRARVGGITLKGTDALGNTVEVPLTYRVDSNEALFDNVLPGNYTVEIPAIPFLQNATTPTIIPVTSATDDGDMVVDTDLGRLRPEFISIRDWLGSAPVKSFLVAATPGQISNFAVPSSAADTVRTLDDQNAAQDTQLNDPQVQFDSDGSNLTIRGTDGSGSSIEATLPTTGDSRVQVRGVADGIQLLRVSVDESDVTFAETVASSGEGEFFASSSSRQAEGEELASAAVTVADLFVPSARDIDLRNDATVLPLETGDVWFAESEANRQPDQAGPDSGSVDSAMNEIGPELTIHSSAEAVVAKGSGETTSLDETAIDALLASEVL